LANDLGLSKTNVEDTQNMKEAQLFYQPSGKIDPIRQSLLYLICIGIALVMGYFYTIAICFIPIIYFNVLITVGFGILLGVVCRLFARFSHNRNRRSQIYQAIFVGIIANYFQWTAYCLFFIDNEIPSFGHYISNLDWILFSGDFSFFIGELNRFGAWTIFGGVINGTTLTVVWIVEFLLIALLPMIGVLQTKVYPYSELFNKWYEKYTLKKDFHPVSMSTKMISDLNLNPIETIELLNKGLAFRHCKIHLFYLKGEKNQYLTFENIYYEGSGSKTDKKGDIVINNFLISDEVAKQILEKFPTVRERIEVL
jgi:hypothetical protein